MYIAVTKFNMYMYYMTIFKIYYFAEFFTVFFFKYTYQKKTNQNTGYTMQRLMY